MIIMTWKDALRKILDEDSEDMTGFMNISPRMEEAAKNRKAIKDSKTHMIDQILDRMEDIENDLDESVTKQSMVALLEALSAIELVKEEEPKAKKTETNEFDPSSYLDSKSRGGDFDGQGV